MKKSWKKFFKIAFMTLGATYVGLSVIARKKKGDSIFADKPEEQNPMEGKKVIFVESESDKQNADGVCGHLEAVGDAHHVQSVYERYIKRALDVILSFGGLVVLSPVFLAVSLAIFIDDPGPVMFTQKRIGQNKKYFKLHKFRSMKMSTPHDVPTHMLSNPEQYITRVGKFIRSHSLDELPQIWDIFVGNMSVIGPRPALWNQDVLTAERDKYDANDIKPGLTGWAQINGRDVLELSDKAKLDGEYARSLSLRMDIKCFIDSVKVILGDDSVVEGGTGELNKTLSTSDIGRHYTDGRSDDALIGHIGFDEPVVVDKSATKRVLVTGAGSYIGESFRQYASEHYPTLTVDVVDMLDASWRDKSFTGYDAVYHVAGIAHADVGHTDDATKEKYYAVNTDLTVEVCRKAKREGVNRFIFMSSMIIYGDSAPYGTVKVVDEHTVPHPDNFYGDSKLQADVAIRDLADEKFKVIVLRPPMIYGRGSKGNYPILAKLAKKLPVFPNVDNERSMLYIENLCEFVCQVLLISEIRYDSVVLFPQNGEWTNTSRMVSKIASASGRHILLVGSIMKLAVLIGSKVPGKIGGLVNKAFGNNCYAHSISKYEGIEYQAVGLTESVQRTEGSASTQAEVGSYTKHILVVSQYFYPENFRINDMCREWVRRGYKVTVVTGIPNYPVGEYYEGYDLTHKRHEGWNGIEIHRIPLIPRGKSSIGLILNYLSFMVSGMIAGKLMKLDADMVFSYEVSPMTQVFTGISFAKRLHVPHYLYVQDLWPENVVAVTGIKNPLAIRMIDRMVDSIYRDSDQIFATSPSFVDAICNRPVRVLRDKVHYWPQYAEEYYQPCMDPDRSVVDATDSFRIAFTGNIGNAQGLQLLPKVAALLKGTDLKFVIVGDGRYKDQLIEEIHRADVESMFVLIPRQPAEKIPQILGACDVAFLSFADDPLWTKTIPAKLQSYMACGMPILAVAGGETERIIKEAECGMCCPIGDVEKLADMIRQMMAADLETMGTRSRAYCEKHFDKMALMDEMEEWFRTE